MLTPSQFLHYQNLGYTHIPLIKKFLSDDKTPVSVFASMQALDGLAYLFESVVGGERFARYSMIGLGGSTMFEYQDGVLYKTTADGQNATPTHDPLAYIRQFMAQFNMPTKELISDLPLFSGGLVGYFGYDLIRCIEPSVGQSDKPNPLGLPDLWLMSSTEVVVFDNLEHTLSVVVYADCAKADGYTIAKQRLQAIEQALNAPADLSSGICAKPEFVSHTGQEKFCQDVATIKDYILKGDVMQVVPAQRVSADFAGDALSVYRALRYLNPSPYLFMIQGQLSQQSKQITTPTTPNHDISSIQSSSIQPHQTTIPAQSNPIQSSLKTSFDIIGASPEILARIEQGKVTVRPLAGTRRRGHNREEDLALEQELLSDQKEIAEHLMLIDLGRNDIGRVCKVGTVQVTDKMFVERYSQVMHIASNVEGQIKDDVDALSVFAATFPAGTLSGAPKVRAMQIIDELEPVRRTVFGGAVGYLGWHGNMDTAIAIRTAVIKDGQIHIQAGAGVVADSDPMAEWDETNKKALALVKAVELACRGLVVE